MSSPVVLITGALTGIGRAAAIIFAQRQGRASTDCRRRRVGISTGRTLRVSEEHQADDVRRERQPRCHCLYKGFALTRAEHAKCQTDPLCRCQPRIVV
jgi:NAD(P)-dependent dehydrogenase (short-subunit alcohol dehydrogenase family)